MKTRKATARHVTGAVYIHNTVCKLITRSIPGNEYRCRTKTIQRLETITVAKLHALHFVFNTAGFIPAISSFITTLHGMQTWSSNENSVRLSVTRVNCDKTVERYSRFLYDTKDHLA